MLLFDSTSQDVLSVVVAFLVTTIAYFKRSYQYWKRKGLPNLEPGFPFGNVGKVLRGKENMGITMRGIYQEMKKRKWKHGGIYVVLSPNYFVLDLDYIKNMMTKDFQHFVDHTTFYNEEDDPLTAHIASLTGKKWRNLRARLTPTFTSGKMKMMFQTLVDCENNLHKKMETEITNKKPIDIKEILACFTTDIIGSCAFGLDCKSFEEENSPFRLYAKKNFAASRSQFLKRTFAMNFPKLAKMLRLTIIPKDVAIFFMKVVRDTVEYREKNNYIRNDFMQLLIDMKNNKLVGDDGQKVKGQSLTMNELSAQCFVFFKAGFETSSTLMTFTLYELSKNQEIQEKLRDEINTVLAKHGGQITYDAILQMKYMDQVINESLRKYPPVPLTNRTCVKDYKVPGPDDDVIIKKGITVIIPIMGIHYDEEYYPHPDKFDPERFNDENKRSRHHYAHIPFGKGPRSCIGMRFGLIQAKVGLTTLLKNYKFTVNKKTIEPLNMLASNIILRAVGGIWLDVQKL